MFVQFSQLLVRFVWDITHGPPAPTRHSMDMQRLVLITLACVMSVGALRVDDFQYLKPSKLQTKTSPDVQKVAAQNAICSILQSHPQCALLFRVVEINHDLLKDEKDTFTFWTEEINSRNILKISASSGVAAAWGFHYYVKEYLNWHVGWQVRNIILDSNNVLLPANKTVVVAADRFRYYQNVCTSSYSFVWWSAAEWEAHIYWMALNGINLSLAPLGQEEVWRRVYTQFGLTEDEIQEHFTGPAFLSWQRMGNVRGWGGPLPQAWHRNANVIQRRILKVMRDLGMVPVLPAFAGHVPRAFARVFPNATLHQTQTWNGFSDDYCCPLFVDPADPLFRTIGTSFLRESTGDNGLSNIYNADPFNELRMGPGVWTNDFVRSVGDAIFSSVSAVDPSAVWLLQNWMFVHDSDLWPRERVREYLLSVPRGRALVLDLQSEQWPQYYAYDMYFGQPFVWCMLHNFGGTLGMFGNMQTINGEVYATREHSNSTMLGVGLTMEGINQNYVVYDLMLETGWRRNPVDLDEWTASYARRRYGCGNATARGWRYLLRSVYSFRGLNRMRGKYAVTRRPSLGIKPWAWYRSRHLFEAWREFAAASRQCGSSDAFLYDLTDITRQALQYRAEQLYLRVVNRLHLNCMEAEFRLAAQEAIDAFLEIMNDMDSILSTRVDFSLWSWLQAARSAGIDTGDEELYEMNARNQITLWGPNGEITDYACKQWAGMFRWYYAPRWKIFLETALAAAAQKDNVDNYFDQKIVQQAACDAVYRQFAATHVDPPYITDNGTRTIALYLLDKWGVLPDAEDLPQNVLYAEEGRAITLADIDDDENLTAEAAPSVRFLRSTTPLN